MSVWLVRAGRFGENEAKALDEGIVTIGWNSMPDLAKVATRDELTALYESLHPDASKGRVANQVGQIWAFTSRINQGDLVVLPLKTQSSIAIGKIASNYTYTTAMGDGVRHVRKVDWLRTDIPRTAFDQDLLYSFGAFMTVCQIQRNNAEQRIKALLNGNKPPQLVKSNVDVIEDDPTNIDIEEAARDQIVEYIQQKFAGHNLANLVDAVLQAEGYLTRISPPGADGGVDILAGSGPMGFGSPRLCVQVKSGQSPADVTVLRELQGILQGYQAQQGLLVSWGGFKKSVLNEAKQSFFTIRLWDSGDLFKAIVRNYDRLPDELQAELPLKRCWALVLEE